MHPLLDMRHWPRILLHHPLLILTAILLGAGLAFAYSYAPLHRAKNWEIAYLNDRLESRTGQLEDLETRLRQADSALDAATVERRGSCPPGAARRGQWPEWLAPEAGPRARGQARANDPQPQLLEEEARRVPG